MWEKKESSGRGVELPGILTTLDQAKPLNNSRVMTKEMTFFIIHSMDIN
jgi:hypothetical protein